MSVGFLPRRLALRKHGASSPLKVNQMGRYVWSVAALGVGRSGSGKGPTFSAPFSAWGFFGKCPNSSNGDLHLPFS